MTRCSSASTHSTATIDSGLAPWSERIALLQTIPGIDRPSACAILAEIGPDLDAFGSGQRLAAMGGACVRATARAPASAARPAPAWAARRCARCSSSALMARPAPTAASSAANHKALMLRRGYKRAIVATAHKLAARALHRAARRPAPTVTRRPTTKPSWSGATLRAGSACCYRYGLIDYEPAAPA